MSRTGVAGVNGRPSSSHSRALAITPHDDTRDPPDQAKRAPGRLPGRMITGKLDTGTAGSRCQHLRRSPMRTPWPLDLATPVTRGAL